MDTYYQPRTAKNRESRAIDNQKEGLSAYVSGLVDDGFVSKMRVVRCGRFTAVEASVGIDRIIA